MKWVKHMTNCTQDPKIRSIRAEFGNDGYAAYWIIVETIAANFTKQHPAAELTFSAKTWAKICEISQKKLKNFLEFSEKINLVSHEYNEEFLTISVRNLLKYGDEYSNRKQGKTEDCPDTIPTISGHSPDPVRASSSTSSSNSISPIQVDKLSTGYIGLNPETGEIIEYPKAVAK
jgi:hypothetical protein